MAPHKGIENLVRAFATMRASSPGEASLQIVGPWADKAYEARIRRLVADLGVGEHVGFTGFVDRARLHGLYAESRVFALLSRCESFSIPSAEAQAFGTPVVGSESSSAPEVCGAGGLFLSPNDVDGAASALRRVVREEAVWRQLSMAARENAKRYSWDGCAARFLAGLERGSGAVGGPYPPAVTS
jgi:glycosyltransferase involved in cell wall biosynthesis